jgi:hypothetical protein
VTVFLTMRLQEAIKVGIVGVITDIVVASRRNIMNTIYEIRGKFLAFEADANRVAMAVDAVYIQCLQASLLASKR